MERLVVVIMGQDCEKFIRMCLESVKEADAIVYCDGGSTNEFKSYWIREIVKKKNMKNIHWIENLYNQEDKKMNGKQRNFYLNYIKENYPDYWCLCIDVDEVVENLSKVKEFIQTAKYGLISVKMRHLVGDLSHEDTTQENHWVLNRLFKISEADCYPETEHPVLQGKEREPVMATNCTTIWHLAYIPGMFDIKKKYENHIKKSEMHSKEFLRDWYFQHLFGYYPRKRFNLGELPEIILNEFGTSQEEIYFISRGNMEVKHYQDAINWKNHFNLKDCIIFGCGQGQRVKVLNEIGVKTVGYDVNKYAVEKRLHENVKLADMTVEDLGLGSYDLAVAFDVLEHLNYGEDLTKAINNLINHTKKYILISVPVIGNPVLELDATHKIKETEEWWLKQFTDKGLKRIETPNYFLYKEQVYIFEK